MAMTSTPPLALAARNSKLWCQGFLRGEPKEIGILRDYLDSLWKGKDIESYYKSDEGIYPSKLAELLNSTLDVKFGHVSPSARARFIAYILAKWVKIPFSSSRNLRETSDWLIGHLDRHKDYSASDLETIRLAYRVFCFRRPALIRKIFPGGSGDEFEVIFASLFKVGADVGSTAFVEHLVPVMAASAHIPFVPLPLFTVYTVYKLAKHPPFDRETNEKINQVESKFVELLGPKLNVDRLGQSWNDSFSHVVVKPHDSLAQDGVLKLLVEEHSKLLAAQPEAKKQSMRLLVSWARDVSRVNSLYWPEIIASFEVLRTTSRQIGFNEEEARPLLSVFEKTAASWNFDASAQDAARTFLDAPYQRQPLTPQAEP